MERASFRRLQYLNIQLIVVVLCQLWQNEATKSILTRERVRTVNATLNDPVNSAINAYTLKNLIQGTGKVSTAVFTGTTPIVAPVSP